MPNVSNDNEILSEVSTLLDGCDSLSAAVSTFIDLVGVPSAFEQSDFETVDDNVVCVEPLHSNDRSIIDSVNGTIEETDDEEESQEESQDTAGEGGRSRRSSTNGGTTSHFFFESTGHRFESFC